MFCDGRVSSYMLVPNTGDDNVFKINGKSHAKTNNSPPPIPIKQIIGKKSKDKVAVMASNKRRYSQMMQESLPEDTNGGYENKQEELRKQLNQERHTVRKLRKENLELTQNLREGKRRENTLQETHNRLELQINVLLSNKEVRLEKKYKAQITRILNVKEEEIKQLKLDYDRELEEMRSKIRTLQRSSSHISSPRASIQSAPELDVLKNQRKYLEEMLQAVMESEKKKDDELAKQNELHGKKIASLKTDMQNEIRKMKKEIRVKQNILMDQEKQIKKLEEDKLSSALKAETYKKNCISANEAKFRNKLKLSQEKINLLQESITMKDIDHEKQMNILSRKHESELVQLVNDSCKRETDLKNQISKQSAQYEKLRSSLAKKLEDTSAVIGPLKNKKNELVIRNVELRGKVKELELSLRRLQDENCPQEDSATKIKVDVPEKYEKLEIGDFHESYGKLQLEHQELQRSYRFLQSKLSSSTEDTERESKRLLHLSQKFDLATQKIFDLERFITTKANLQKLIEEKQEVHHLNLKLLEKVADAKERENTLKREFEECKDRAELTEFRILELEEKLENIQDSNISKTDASTDTNDVNFSWQSSDSGFSSLNHSRCPSVSTEASNGTVSRLDFRDEKVKDTQKKLESLISDVHGNQGKSLLLQTVALFEALLVKLTLLQRENDEFKKRDGMLERTTMVDRLLLDVEELNKTNRQLKQELHAHEMDLETLKKEKMKIEAELKNKAEVINKKEEHFHKTLEYQRKTEDDLRKQVNKLNQKVADTLFGCKNESQMYAESLQKVSYLERNLSQADERIKVLEKENRSMRNKHIQTGDNDMELETDDDEYMSDSVHSNYEPEENSTTSGFLSQMSTIRADELTAEIECLSHDNCLHETYKKTQNVSYPTKSKCEEHLQNLTKYLQTEEMSYLKYVCMLNLGLLISNMCCQFFISLGEKLILLPYKQTMNVEKEWQNADMPSKVEKDRHTIDLLEEIRNLNKKILDLTHEKEVFKKESRAKHEKLEMDMTYYGKVLQDIGTQLSANGTCIKYENLGSIISGMVQQISSLSLKLDDSKANCSLLKSSLHHAQMTNSEMKNSFNDKYQEVLQRNEQLEHSLSEYKQCNTIHHYYENPDKIMSNVMHNRDDIGSISNAENLQSIIQRYVDENNHLQNELCQYRENEHIIRDLKQREAMLLKRVEESEISDLQLQRSFQERDEIYIIKERKLLDQVKLLQRELEHQKSESLQSENTCEMYKANDQSQISKVKELEAKIRELGIAIQHERSLKEDTEASLRNEITKSRQNVQQTQNQLIELDKMNSQLQTTILSKDTTIKEENDKIEALKHELEKVLVSLRRVTEERDSLIQEKTSLSFNADESSERGESASISLLNELQRCESDELIPSENMATDIGDENEVELSIDDTFLETQLTRLQEKLDHMESEMTLVNEESQELQQRVQRGQDEIERKARSISELAIKEVQGEGNSLVARNDLTPPQDFRITRRVGSDGLLVAWKPPDDESVTGYLIFVDGKLSQRVRSATRTKALLHNLNLGHLEDDSKLEVSAHSTNVDGEISSQVAIYYDKNTAENLFHKKNEKCQKMEISINPSL